MGERYREEAASRRRRRSYSPERRHSPERRRVRRRYEREPSASPRGYGPEEAVPETASVQFRDAEEERKMTRDMLSGRERDARTIFVWQLASKVGERDVYDFFSRAGKVRDVRLIIDRRTGKHKGAGYVEFYKSESVPPALRYSGQLIRNFPVAIKGPEASPTPVDPNGIIQPPPVPPPRPPMPAALRKEPTPKSPPPVLSPSELIKLLNPAGLPPPKSPAAATHEFTRLYVGSIPFSVTEADLRSIFEPFGTLKSLAVQVDPATQRSKGYGFIEYYQHEAAAKALGINGINVAGRPLRVALATQTNTPVNVSLNSNGNVYAGLTPQVDGKAQMVSDTVGELDEGGEGLKMDAKRRQALMASISGKKIADDKQEEERPSRCIRLGNMFDPGGGADADPGWMEELTEEVRDECNGRFGRVIHMRIEPNSQGCVYIMFKEDVVAKRAKLTMHRRWFGGRQLTSSFVDEEEYRKKFKDVPDE